MATWVYFTSYLDGSRFITKNERDELYDNFNSLLTGDCSSAGYSLNSTHQTSIKDSLLLTDRASLDGPGGSNTRDRFHAVITAASSAFSNYSSAVTTALSGEGITSTQRDSIINSDFDDHRLWNYYKRLIDALTCPPPYPSISSVQCRTRSASKTKCGFSEFGTPSSPPKIYRTMSQSGTLTMNFGTLESPFNYTDTYSGSKNYTRPGCSYSDDRKITIGSPDCGSTDVSNWVEEGDEVLRWVRELSPDCTAGNTGSTGATITTTSSTALFFDADSWGNPDYDSGMLSVTLSNEYTTSDLRSDALTAMLAASYGSYGASCPGGTYTLTTDELTATLRQCEYKVSFSAAVPAGTKLHFDYYQNGVFQAHNCISLTAGDTQWIDNILPPNTANATDTWQDFYLSTSC
jgi:hypothetical protein